jgi:alkylation response protein AidB-like acyl-CoA dehydrogenase
MSPMGFLQMIERISVADASVGWVASFGSASVYLAALPKETQAKLYAKGPDLTFAGGLFPLQPAEQVEGGWMVNGTWKFASGCKGADMLGVGIGAAVPGRPAPSRAPPCCRRSRSRSSTTGTSWAWSAPAATTSRSASNSCRGVDLHPWRRATIDEPLYRYPTIAYAAQVLAVVNLGVGRAAIDEINQMSGGRVAITGAPKLADRSYVRIEVAKAEARLRSARAFLYDATSEVWHSILAGNPVTPEQVSLLRLTAVEIAKVGNEVVQAMFGLAGTTAIYSNHPCSAARCRRGQAARLPGRGHL